MEREILSFPTDSLVNQLVVKRTMHCLSHIGNLRNLEVFKKMSVMFSSALTLFSLNYVSLWPSSYAADCEYECSKPKLYLSSLVSNPYNKNTQVENSTTNIITLV